MCVNSFFSNLICSYPNDPKFINSLSAGNTRVTKYVITLGAKSTIWPENPSQSSPDGLFNVCHSEVWPWLRFFSPWWSLSFIHRMAAACCKAEDKSRSAFSLRVSDSSTMPLSFSILLPYSCRCFTCVIHALCLCVEVISDQFGLVILWKVREELLGLFLVPGCNWWYREKFRMSTTLLPLFSYDEAKVGHEREI